MNNVIKGNLPTGGPLNFLNEAAQTNSRKNTVPVMALVAAHKPNSSEELKELIKNHRFGRGHMYQDINTKILYRTFLKE